MAIDLENLPDDAGALRELVTNAELENAGLRAEIDKLHMMIKGFQRHRFGKRSEQLDAEQMQLVMEDGGRTMSHFRFKLSSTPWIFIRVLPQLPSRKQQHLRRLSLDGCRYRTRILMMKFHSS